MKPCYFALARWCLLTIAGLSASQAGAQTSEPEAAAQVVRVTALRDPAILPYKKAYEFMSQVAGVSHNRVHLAIRVFSAKDRLPIPDLDITLRGEHTFTKIAIGPTGLLSVPLDEAIYADNADFVTNKKKGELVADITLVPTLPAEAMTYGDIVDSIESARRARAEILPWYLRMVLPNIKKVGLCYPDSLRVVSISKSEEASRSALSEEKDRASAGTVFCALFSPDESGIARDSLIAAPAGWEPIFL